MTGTTCVEAHLRRDEAVELPDLLVVAAEQGEEAGLRAGRALRAAERQLVAPAFEFAAGRGRNRSSHRQARLPTVVSCAGWKCVKPSVGSSFHRSANAASASITRGERRRRAAAGSRASGSGRCCR